MKSQLAVVAALMATTSCVETSHMWSTDRTFSRDETEAIREAADEWCTQSEGRYCVELVDGAPNRILRMRGGSGTAQDAQWQGTHAPCLGTGTHVETIRLWVADEEVATWPGWHEYVRTTIEHELGHHFDKDDTSEPGHIMSGTGPSRASHLSEQDLQ